jgi:hypothetical protein
LLHGKTTFNPGRSWKLARGITQWLRKTLTGAKLQELVETGGALAANHFSAFANRGCPFGFRS